MTSPAFLFLLEDDFIKILAIDQARNGAWSVFDYETKTLEAYGVFSFNNKDYTYAKAIRAIEELVDSLIKTYDISAVFIEDIQRHARYQRIPHGILLIQESRIRPLFYLEPGAPLVHDHSKNLRSYKESSLISLRRMNTCMISLLLRNGKTTVRPEDVVQRKSKKRLKPWSYLERRSLKFFPFNL